MKRENRLTAWARGIHVVRSTMLLSFVFVGCGSSFTAASAEEMGIAGSAGTSGTVAIGGGQHMPTAGASAQAGAGGATGPTLGVCDRTSWVATAFSSYTDAYGGLPAATLDGDPATRWTSGDYQAALQWFSVDVGGARLRGIRVTSIRTPGDQAPSAELEIDGAKASTTVTHAEQFVDYVFPEQHVGVAKLVLRDPAVDWWSIDEFEGMCD